MLSSAFNVRVPLSAGDVFLMNTLTDAQLVVSPDVAELLDGREPAQDGAQMPPATREAVSALAEHGFLVPTREREWEALETHFARHREDASELRVTVLTTLQCNFACDYCYQGDHAPSSAPAAKMSPETAGRVVAWVEREMARVRPRRLVLTFFGGEPLLNTPAMFEIAGRCWLAAQEAGIEQAVTIITNGLLLSPAIVERLLPFGLRAVKVTLDGDRETHDRTRPLRGGQGTFDRIIENIRQVAPLVPISIGGNFDAASVESYPALLDFLKDQDFAGQIRQVAFKPVIRPSAQAAPRGVIPLTLVGQDRAPLNGSCTTSAGSSSGSVCDSCHFVDDQMAFLQGETRRHGFATVDGVHMGPCELYRRHSHTIGPDGSLFACPGFTGDQAQAVGHIHRDADPVQAAASARFGRLAPWRQCGDCAFIPEIGRASCRERV